MTVRDRPALGHSGNRTKGEPSAYENEAGRVTGSAPDWAAGLAGLPDTLPPGRFVLRDGTERSAEEGGDSVMWLSDEPVDGIVHWWGAVQERQQETGLRPVFVGWPDSGPAPCESADVDAIDGEEWLATSWEQYRRSRRRPQYDPGPPYESWPGLAPAPARIPDAETAARRAVADTCPRLPQGRQHLGLVAAARSADIPALTGWPGSARHLRPAELSAVLRTWEDRFGARVLGMTGSMLYVSVAAPPTGPEQSVHVALEHLLLCPANIYQSFSETFPRYAVRLRDESVWSFWWD
ncbi:DUF4253 domain-containing protein [Streptomyces scopuliridis]|uniref:DUF4253 domain-containing protein n=1 Tax=Streptomyces scopuliridis TaxID=452529 RepID=UPI0036BE326F